MNKADGMFEQACAWMRGLGVGLVLGLTGMGPALARPATPPHPAQRAPTRAMGIVTTMIRQTATQVILDNGVLVATITKATSNLVSLQYNGVETLNQLGASRKGGYYDLTTSAGFETMNNCVFTITKDSNNVADVAFKRTYNPTTGQVTPCDAEIHYVLNRNDTGLYTYSILEHRPPTPLSTWARGGRCCG